ncbi:MAG: EFR1 family ferrodoxin [Desulfobacterales bacterium]|nr:EFR1 family ferrodoxin [Desulfobacterales bacterium]
MRVSSIKLVYFSPTGTTKKVLEGIAKGIGVENIEHVSMTLPDATTKPLENFTDELVMIGAPVYAGRLPDDAIKRFKRIRAKNTPAVIVVVYGNREYEDALLELTNLSKDLGFIPISAGAFIGEHSYSTQDVPIANDRPDTKDIEKATEFGAAIMRKMRDIQTLDDVSPLNVPGNFPYKDATSSLPESPETLENICTTCGTCADLCPKAAITVNDKVETNQNICIKCCACVKGCPESARVMNAPRIKGVAKWLNENYSFRKEPEVFI